MSASDDKLEALMNAAVAGQERLEKEAQGETGDDSVLVIEDHDAGDTDDSDDIVLAVDDEAPAEAPAKTDPPPEQATASTPDAPPKKTAQDIVTEALIQAKNEALEVLKQTQKEAKSLQERLLRVSADFDNFRKRSRKQQEDAVKYANEGLLRELLPVIDNFDRAVEHVPADTDDPLAQGVKMVHVLLVSTLEKLNCKGFSAVGQAFDPERHEAVEQQATDEVPAGSVVREYQKGYLLGDRLLRPAMVVVATPASPPAASESDDDEGELVSPPPEGETPSDSAPDVGGPVQTATADNTDERSSETQQAEPAPAAVTAEGAAPAAEPTNTEDKDDA